MLVLTRKEGEKIYFEIDDVEALVEALKNGERFSIEPTRIYGNKVGLGIEAPRAVKVLRDDVISRDPPPNRDRTDGSDHLPGRPGDLPSPIGSGIDQS